MGKGETEAQRGEGPFPGSHSGFPFCLHSANLAHCKVFVPCPSRRSRLWEGKLAQRREGPARQGCAGLSSLLWLPPRPVSSHLSRSEVSVTPDTAGSSPRRREASQTRALRGPPAHTGSLSVPNTHSRWGGHGGPLSPLKAPGDFQSLLLPPTRGLSAWAADSTGGGRLGGEAEHGDPLKRRRQRCCTSRAAWEREVAPQCPHLQNGAKSVRLGRVYSAGSGGGRERQGSRVPRGCRPAPARPEGQAGGGARGRAGAGAQARRGAHSTMAGRWCAAAAAAAAASAGACACGAGSAGEWACSAALGGRWRALFWCARRPASCE